MTEKKTEKKDDFDLDDFDMNAIAARTPSDRTTAVAGSDSGSETARASETDSESGGGTDDESGRGATAAEVEAQLREEEEEREKVNLERAMHEQAAKAKEINTAERLRASVAATAAAEEQALETEDAEHKAEFERQLAAAEALKAEEQKARMSEPSVIISPSLVPEAPSLASKNSMPGQARTRIRVGRSPDNEWVIDNRTVSMEHAVLTLDEGSIKVEDLTSSNGTFVANREGGWDRLKPGQPVHVVIGQPIAFGEVKVTSSHDDQNQTHLHFMDEGGKASLSQIFFMDGEKLEELHRQRAAAAAAAEAAAEQARPRVRTPDEIDAENAAKRSPTSMQKEMEAGGSTSRKVATILGFGCLAVLVCACIGFSFMWAANHIPGSGTLATTEPTVPTSDTGEPPVEFSCRAGTTVSTCSHVTGFILGATGHSAYWDCSALTPDQTHDMFTRAGEYDDFQIVANNCACQLCEPVATASR